MPDLVRAVQGHGPGSHRLAVVVGLFGGELGALAVVAGDVPSEQVVFAFVEMVGLSLGAEGRGLFMSAGSKLQRLRPIVVVAVALVVTVALVPEPDIIAGLVEVVILSRPSEGLVGSVLHHIILLVESLLPESIVLGRQGVESVLLLRLEPILLWRIKPILLLRLEPVLLLRRLELVVLLLRLKLVVLLRLKLLLLLRLKLLEIILSSWACGENVSDCIEKSALGRNHGNGYAKRDC